MIARATGKVRPGLRPQLPSRFEDTPIATEVDLSPPKDDHPATASGMNPDPPAARESVLTPEPTEPERTEDQGHAPLSTSSTIPPLPATALSLALRPPVDSDRPHKKALQPIEDRKEDEPPPLRSHVRPGTRQRPSHTSDPTAIATDHAPLSGPDMLNDDEAPSPLLPRDPNMASEQIKQVIDTAPSLSPQRPPEAKEVPPEITIHIGRLELRSETPKPQVRRKTAAPSKVSSLSDYLQGKAQ